MKNNNNTNKNSCDATNNNIEEMYDWFESQINGQKDNKNIAEQMQDNVRASFEFMKSPQNFARELKKSVIGQDDYIDKLSTAFWLHKQKYHLKNKSKDFVKNNMLVIGKSGSGRTLSLKKAAKLINMPIVIEDASQLTGSGWKGKSVTDVLDSLMHECNYDTNIAEFGIVVLDEADKVLNKNSFLESELSFNPTNNLLKVIEGEKYKKDKWDKALDTSNILFILLGAFDGLDEIIQNRRKETRTFGFGASVAKKEIPDKNILQRATKEDLIEYGINPQLMGRISIITAINELEVKDMVNILENSKESIVKKYDNFLFESQGMHLSISSKAMRYFEEEAAKEQTGARALQEKITNIIIPELYKLPSYRNCNKLIVDINKDGNPACSYKKGQRYNESFKNDVTTIDLSSVELDIDSNLSLEKAYFMASMMITDVATYYKQYIANTNDISFSPALTLLLAAAFEYASYNKKQPDDKVTLNEISKILHSNIRTFFAPKKSGKLLSEKNPTEDIKFLFKKASLFTGDIKHTCMQGVNILYAYFKMQKSDKLDPEIEQFELNI